LLSPGVALRRPHSAPLSAVPSTWRSPTARPLVGGLDATAGRPTQAPPTSGLVVALGEVVGTARAAILLICPPGEGTPLSCVPYSAQL